MRNIRATRGRIGAEPAQRLGAPAAGAVLGAGAEPSAEARTVGRACGMGYHGGAPLGGAGAARGRSAGGDQGQGEFGKEEEEEEEV